VITQAATDKPEMKIAVKQVCTVQYVRICIKAANGLWQWVKYHAMFEKTIKWISSFIWRESIYQINIQTVKL